MALRCCLIHFGPETIDYPTLVEVTIDLVFQLILVYSHAFLVRYYCWLMLT